MINQQITCDLLIIALAMLSFWLNSSSRAIKMENNMPNIADFASRIRLFVEKFPAKQPF